MAEDPIATFLQKAQIMMRITERALRTQRLGEWALLRQVRPDGSSKDPDVRHFLPDRGSSLALDDAGFIPELSERLVCSTARFPVVNACENLVGAAQVHATALAEKRIRTASVAALCRAAIESSAKTIWLLSDTSREVRRARCLGYIERERSYQQAFDNIEEEIFKVRTDPAKATDYQAFLRHRARYESRLNAIASLPETARIRPTRRFEKIVKSSAEWIDADQPPHARTELSKLGMTLGAMRCYSFGSSFVHGFKWIDDYVGGEEDLLKLMADGFAAALIMTESAVALFEAQSTSEARAIVRRKNYPEWLVPTVDAWGPRYR
ncbi:MAG: hypothetical protein WCF69_26795 [Mycobacterium sp.]